LFKQCPRCQGKYGESAGTGILAIKDLAMLMQPKINSWRQCLNHFLCKIPMPMPTTKMYLSWLLGIKTINRNNPVCLSDAQDAKVSTGKWQVLIFWQLKIWQC
jgi:hypothetical protein